MIQATFRIAACAFVGICAWQCARLALARTQLVKSTRRKLELEDILRDRTLCFMVFCGSGVVISYATLPWLIIPCIPLAHVLAKRAPNALDARKAKELRSACDEHVDVMSDIVAMGVSSGLSFDAALDLYCGKFNNPLAQQLRTSRIEWQSGLASRQEALAALSKRIDSKALKRFSETSLQAIHHGSPLTDMLARFSRDIRQRRHAAIERQIAKAPVKLLIPTGTCILPAMLILVMGPVLLQFVQTGF